MKHIIKASVFLFLFIAIVYAGESLKLGKPITLKKVTKISNILADPDNYIGKKVLVEGRILDVCEKRGCWIQISSDKEFQSIRIKVDDGEIVFPMEAKGNKALVEGVVYSEVVKKENKEKNESDGDNCDADKKPGEKVYMIKGLGAEIK